MLLLIAGHLDHPPNQYQQRCEGEEEQAEPPKYIRGRFCRTGVHRGSFPVGYLQPGEVGNECSQSQLAPGGNGEGRSAQWG